jgi:hypothetical protein
MLKLDAEMDSATEVVRTRGLRKRFGDVEAVRGVDIDVRPVLVPLTALVVAWATHVVRRAVA